MPRTFAGMISIRQCLEIMHSGAVFSLKVVAYDKRRKDKTGQVKEYREAVLVWGNGEKSRKTTPGERQPTALERSLLSEAPIQDTGRNPNHQWHYTRNIRLLMDGLPTESIKKIHPPLIIEFNGETTTP